MPNPHHTPSSKSPNPNPSMPQSGRGKGKGEEDHYSVVITMIHEAKTALRAAASQSPAAAPRIRAPVHAPLAAASEPPHLVPPAAS